MDCTVPVKVAVTVAVPPCSTVQAPEPEQAPLQPVNCDPSLGVAVRVTEVPVANVALQVLPQSIPDGELVTLPAWSPARVTLRFKGVVGGGALLTMPWHPERKAAAANNAHRLI